MAEWCWDAASFKDYDNAPSLSIDPTGPSTPSDGRKTRTYRGRSLRDGPWKLRSSAREYWFEDSGQEFIGFRVARNQPAEGLRKSKDGIPVK